MRFISEKLNKNLGMLTVCWLISAVCYAKSAIDLEIEQVQSTSVDGYEFSTQWRVNETGSLSLWQGFDHEWQRFVVAKNSGRVPHRLSKFHNFIAANADTAVNPPQAIMGQSTGVDGNYMRPKTFYSTLPSTELTVFDGSAKFRWIDNLSEDEHPVAISQIRETIDLPATLLPASADANTSVILRGFELNLHCDDEQQPEGKPCNSDGAWPYLFRIKLEQCLQTTESLQAMNCQLAVDFYRAWTPNKGGFQLPPLINEVKPINHRLSYELVVHYSVLSGKDDKLSIVSQNASASEYPLQSEPKAAEAYAVATKDPALTYVSAITGFSFLLVQPKAIDSTWQRLGSDVAHRGRYLGKLAFSVTNPEQQDSGMLSYQTQQTVWSPATVVNSDVAATLDVQVLGVHSEAEVHSKMAQGKLCINSTDQAPVYSRWKLCGLNNPLAKWIYGAEQSSAVVNLEMH